MNGYPRDMVGYGQKRPRVTWPNGSKVAVQFVLNYEEGAENSILHGDRASEVFLSEIIGVFPQLGMVFRFLHQDLNSRFLCSCDAWRL